ncbi:MAG: tRNA glutamyl-Q(34) synthetase GluQRS [Rhodospirillaceae bacterium]|nr:MAG: tRNA glutamyl-Q(34) synthetase GluQRS [Rhodospirillaceae bacterium]
MNTPIPYRTRFAPSPTGLLHIGHAYAALFAAKMARENGGDFVLRIEDIDTGRCRPAFEAAIYEDLAWLGLEWQSPVRRQSEHLADYQAALDKLDGLGLLYPCFCTRKDILAEIETANGAPHLAATGPDGPLYPGTCRNLSTDERAKRIADGTPFALRLNMGLAQKSGPQLHWMDGVKGKILATPEIFGDVILARKDTPTSYHLAVTVDDHIQNIALITRGTDLFMATHIHRLLQSLLDLNTPHYHHHGLITDADGQRLAKRNKARTLRTIRKSTTHAPRSFAELKTLYTGLS